MTHGSLFSGIGGFDLAAEWMGWENVFSCENNFFCQKIIKKHWPNTKIYGDIKEENFKEWSGRVDILSGGDPCQPSSTAGNNKGIDDSRFLWPEMFRAITEIQPWYIVNENVSGSISNGILDRKIVDLENIGYSCWPPLLIPASAVGAIHRRDRVWLVANSNASRSQAFRKQLAESLRKKNIESESTGTVDALVRPFIQSGQVEKLFTGESPLVRGDNGIPKELDAIAAIGNSIFPKIAFEIFKAIELYNIEQTAQASVATKA